MEIHRRCGGFHIRRGKYRFTTQEAFIAIVDVVAAFHKLIPQVFAVGLGQGIGQFCRVEVGGIGIVFLAEDVVIATCQLGFCYAAVGHGAIDHV